MKRIFLCILLAVIFNLCVNVCVFSESASNDGIAIKREYEKSMREEAKIAPRATKVTAITFYELKKALLVGEQQRIRIDIKSTGIKPKHSDITMYSKNNDIARIINKGNDGFWIEAYKTGKVTIVAECFGRSKSTTLTISGYAPTAVSLDRTRLTIEKGETYTLNGAVSPKKANQKLTWTSSNESIVVVSSNGVVTGKAAGLATITARTDNGFITKCVVTVTSTDRKAMLIGQTYYLSGKLNGPENDLVVMKNVLERSGYTDIKVYENLTANGIKEALWSLSNDGGTRDDVTFFYYSGHGMDSSSILRRGALVGVDENYITVDEVRILLDNVPGSVIAVFDNCLSGQFIQTRSPGGASEPADPYAFNKAVINAFSSGAVQGRSLTDHASSSKYRILTAAEPLQSSYSVMIANNKYFGLMTYFFARGAGIDAISGIVSADADMNNDKVITLNEMYTYIKNNEKSIYLGRRTQNVQVWPAQSSDMILTVP